MRRLTELQFQFPLIIADPPYNVGQKYLDYHDRRPKIEFHEFTMDWMMGVKSLLAPHGSFWCIVPDDMVVMVETIRESLGFGRHSWCIWHYRFGQHHPMGFTPSHAHLLWLGHRGQMPYFNKEAVLEATDRAARYNDIRTYEKPTNRGLRAPLSVWPIARIVGNGLERMSDLPNQIPEKLVGRIIAGCSRPRDLVLDPFAGSGTSISMAQRMGRYGIGFDFELTAEQARIRIERDWKKEFQLHNDDFVIEPSCPIEP